MKRNPSPKQGFIKDYAKLIYGPDAKSNALDNKDRAIIKRLFDVWAEYTDALVKYPNWLATNWETIMDRKHSRKFKADYSKPGTYLFSNSFLSAHLNYARRGENLKTQNPKPLEPNLNPEWMALLDAHLEKEGITLT